MVINTACNQVYFSELLSLDPRYAPAWNRIEAILIKHGVRYELLPYTKDIWCRDYMPVQVDEDEFVMFRYEADYVLERPDEITERKPVLDSLGLQATSIDLIVDGGNVVNWTDRVIMTERVFKDNPMIPRQEVINRLEVAFKTDAFFVRDITDDMTGHVDGHLRFIDGNTVLVNDLKDEFLYWQKSFAKLVHNASLNYEELPWFRQHIRGNSHHAIGCYVNYLEIGNLIVFPVFEVPGNCDDEALRVIEQAFPGRIIEPVNINEIALEGGLMNCVSWSTLK